MSSRRKGEKYVSGSHVFYDPDDPDAVLRQIGVDPDDDKLPPAEPVKPPSTAFVDALAIFVTRVEAEPEAALAFIREHALGVRQAAVVANNLDSTTAGKLTAFIGLVWCVTLEGVVSSMWSVQTDQARARRIARDVATCLDRCATALQPPVDLNMARKGLVDAEACFG